MAVEIKINRDDLAATFVYVMSCGGRTKVGISASPQTRKRQLQNAGGADVVLRSSREFPCRLAAQHVERELHKRFRLHRGHGEWFEVDAHKVCLALHEAEAPVVIPVHYYL